jgi:hypothetical protein
MLAEVFSSTGADRIFVWGSACGERTLGGLGLSVIPVASHLVMEARPLVHFFVTVCAPSSTSVVGLAHGIQGTLKIKVLGPERAS